MDNEISITLLANAGLLIQYNSFTILLDALQKSENTPFSPLPPTLWQGILRGGSQFPRVDALLFTHLHPDHFCAEMTLHYLKQHAAPLVMMPNDLTVFGADAVISQAGSHLIPLANDTPVRYVLTPEIAVLAIPTRHLDKLYYDVPHYCYLLSFGTKNVLITADIDYTYETLSMLDGILLDAVFVNPLFFSALSSNHFFKGKLNAKNICVYHIPFAPDDKLNMRSSIETKVARLQGQTPIVILDQPLQQVAIKGLGF